VSAGVATGWLRGPRFDLAMIAGVLGLALLMGGIAALVPSLFAVVLFVDVWLLAYPHAASTMTRVAFDRRSIREHRFLLFGVPPLVLAATAGATWLGGAAALTTIYFYWQTWHYTRQSYGIARAYHRASGAPAGSRDLLTDVVVFAFPTWGLAHRAHQAQPLFYGSPLIGLPTPWWVVALTGAVALASLVVWAVRRVQRIRAGEPVLASTLYVASHVLITVVSYVAIDEITRGWLFINIWHNAQYLLFVWAANVRRFERGVDPSRPLVSWLSQPSNVGWYAAVCLACGVLFYLAMSRATANVTLALLPVALVVHQASNFYHYVIDAVIWRSKPAKS
jgi:hypothetical protein